MARATEPGQSIILIRIQSDCDSWRRARARGPFINSSAVVCSLSRDCARRSLCWLAAWFIGWLVRWLVGSLARPARRCKSATRSGPPARPALLPVQRPQIGPARGHKGARNCRPVWPGATQRRPQSRANSINCFLSFGPAHSKVRRRVLQTAAVIGQRWAPAGAAARRLARSWPPF